jgi:ATP-dependent DNA helicase RecG
MYYSKDIESFGTGLRRITEACEKAGIEIEFQMLKLGFAVVFYRPDENFLATEKIPDDVRNVVRNVALKKPEQATIKAIAENPAITAEQLAAALSKSERTAQRYLDSLQKKDLIRRVGSTKGGHWEIIADTDSTDK